MKTRSMLLFVVAMGIAASCEPALAHHGGAIYDMTQQQTLKATIAEFDFVNPHVQIYFDVKDNKGNVVHWVAETLSPGKLSREQTGWSREAIKAGDQVTIIVYPAKSGTPVGELMKVILPNGSELVGIAPKDAQRPIN